MAQLICPSCGREQEGTSPLCPGCIRSYVPREEPAVESPAAAAAPPEPVAGPPRMRFPWGEVELPADGRLVVGRENSPLADRLAAYTNVGRRHAQLRLLDGGLVVVDLNSTNGTWVNEERVEPMTPRLLAHGDEVRFAAGLRATVLLGGAR